MWFDELTIVPALLCREGSGSETKQSVLSYDQL